MKGSAILDELTRVGNASRLATRARPQGDAALRTLAIETAGDAEVAKVEAAAKGDQETASDLVARLAAVHLVGRYATATHGIGEPIKQEAEIKRLAEVLRPLRAGWRREALKTHAPTEVAEAEVSYLLHEHVGNAGLAVIPAERDRVGVIVSEDGRSVLSACKRSDGVVLRRRTPRRGRLWEPEPARKGEKGEARKASEGDRARVRSSPADPSSGNLADQHSGDLTGASGDGL